MISKDNTTFNFVIPKDLKEKLEARAKEEGRSIGNLLVKLIKDYLSGNSPSAKAKGFLAFFPIEKRGKK